MWKIWPLLLDLRNKTSSTTLTTLPTQTAQTLLLATARKRTTPRGTASKTPTPLLLKAPKQKRNLEFGPVTIDQVPTMLYLIKNFKYYSTLQTNYCAHKILFSLAISL